MKKLILLFLFLTTNIISIKSAGWRDLFADSRTCSDNCRGWCGGQKWRCRRITPQEAQKEGVPQWFACECL